ncbi:hypothetical protein PsYK624_065080 [Phanerochaete sordida]|uniref:Uncharacterized protein n=1 Tax=Phanerochaete sordida TaxID=48140 RepID=A0A9P3G971_9APHY|nr:hypothetical protein PsYK624_065080 [Phanerochaete sordida]
MALLTPNTVVDLPDATLADYAAEFETLIAKISDCLDGGSSPMQMILKNAEIEATKQHRLVKAEQDRRAAQSKRLGPILQMLNLRERDVFGAVQHAPRVPLRRVQVGEPRAGRGQLSRSCTTYLLLTRL